MDNSVVVFDFDDTILDGNAGNLFIKNQLQKSTIRKTITICLLPLIKLFMKFYYTQTLGRSIPTWISTVGTPEAKINLAIEEFPSTIKLFREAIEEIKRYQKENARILIISGSVEILVVSILDRFIPDQTGITVIASQTSKFLGGYRIRQFCRGKNKITMAKEKQLADNWEVGYSDDYTDIPLLLRCKKRFLVNPDAVSLDKLQNALKGEFKILTWVN